MENWDKNKKHIPRRLLFSNLGYQKQITHDNNNIMNKSQSKDKKSRFLTLDEYREKIEEEQLPKTLIHKKNKADFLINIKQDEEVVKPKVKENLPAFPRRGGMNRGWIEGSILKKKVLKDSNLMTHLKTVNKVNKSTTNSLNQSLNKITTESLKRQDSTKSNARNKYDPMNDAANLVSYYKGVITNVPFHDNTKSFTEIEEDVLFKKYKIHENIEQIEKIKNQHHKLSHSNDKSNLSTIYNQSMYALKHNESFGGSFLSAKVIPRVEISNEFFASQDIAIKTIQINKQIHESVEKIYNDRAKEKCEAKKQKFNLDKLKLEQMPEIKINKPEAHKMMELIKSEMRKESHVNLNQILESNLT